MLLLSSHGICHEHYPVIAAASDGNAAAIRRPWATIGWRHPPNKHPSTHWQQPPCASSNPGPSLTPSISSYDSSFGPAKANQGFENVLPALFSGGLHNRQITGKLNFQILWQFSNSTYLDGGREDLTQIKSSKLQNHNILKYSGSQSPPSIIFPNFTECQQNCLVGN